MDPRLGWLTTFVAVAEELHFGRAAERLHLSTSATSRHVQLLEEAVGRTLFRRSTRAVHLTETGRRLYADTADALATVERGLRAAAGTEPRFISVGYTGAAEADLIPYLAVTWREAELGPLRLLPLPSATQVAALAEGTLDVGIQWEGPGGPGFEVVPLAVEPVHIALPADHPCAGREVIPLTDLAADRWLMAADASDLSMRNRFVDTCRRHGFVPDIRDVATGQGAQVAMVAGGHGLCLVSSVTLSNPTISGIAFARLHEIEATMVAVTTADPPPTVRRLVRTLQHRCLETAATAASGSSRQPTGSWGSDPRAARR